MHVCLFSCLSTFLAALAASFFYPFPCFFSFFSLFSFLSHAASSAVRLLFGYFFLCFLLLLLWQLRLFGHPCHLPLAFFEVFLWLPAVSTIFTFSIGSLYCYAAANFTGAAFIAAASRLFLRFQFIFSQLQIFLAIEKFDWLCGRLLLQGFVT
jgi:hypothetical protein